MAFMVTPSFAAQNKYSKFYKLALQAYREAKFFTASSFLKIYITKSENISKSASYLTSRLLEKTNIYPFLDIPLNQLQNLKEYSNINYLMGKKLLFRKKMKESLEYFQKVSRGSPFYLQALMHTASILEMQGDFKGAIRTAETCVRHAGKSYEIVPDDPTLAQNKREYIQESCQLLIPRTYYKNGEFDKAKKKFEKLSSQSFRFPDILFNSSWVYFVQNDFNRAVGKNLTFQAPLFDDYFIPETELVKTLSYLQLCNYDEAINVIKNFEKNIKSKVNDFMKEFNLKSNKDYSFLKLAFSRKAQSKFKDNFIIKLTNVLKVNPGFQTLKYYYSRIKSEKKRLKGKEEKIAYQIATKKFVSFFNKFVKLKFVGYAKDIIRISNIFAQIELDLYSILKYKLYDARDKKKKAYKRVRFFIKDIDRKSNQYYWNFHGEFWADELGYYIPLLENKCKKGKTL